MMQYQVYYVHGFGSNAESATLQMLRKDFPDAIGLTYDHNDPNGSILALIMQINSCDKFPVIVGSSLGGWYTEQLSKRVVGDFILYNPSTQPEIALAKYGITQDVLFKYKKVSHSPRNDTSTRSVVLCLDDGVIDPTLADVKYKDTAAMIYTSGGHRMTENNMQLIVARIKYLQNQLP